MQEIVSIPFRRENRSYFSTPPGWRLATFEEATNGLEMIKDHNILKTWDRVRLLDGWILGPGYNFQMGNDFKGCLGYMLLIQTDASGCAYANVNISDSQKQVALFLCADDWNYEVVYWLFYSWAKTHTIDLQDVMLGKIPFSNLNKFKDMNSGVCSLARRLGDKGPVSEKAGKRRISGPDSVKGVLSDMIKTVNDENLQQYLSVYSTNIEQYKESCFAWPLEPQWLEDFAEQGGEEWNKIADAIWNFLSESFAGSIVEFFSNRILESIICKLNNEYDMKTITPRQNNFMLASVTLFYLSEKRTDIIHTPLAHDCTNSCAAKMICHVASSYGPADIPRFNQALQDNAMWRCYDHIGDYDVLNKLLVIAAGAHVSLLLETDKLFDLFVVNSLLDFGARLGPAYAIFGSVKLTALETAIMSRDDDDIGKEVVKSLLIKCDGNQQELANAPNEENGLIPLHIASILGRAHLCQTLLDYGAKLNVRDKDGRTALHIAVRRGKDAVVNVIMKHPDITELVDLKDEMGDSPLDAAVIITDMKLVAKLISKSRQPEAYFDKVDLTQLLRYSLLDGSVDIVRNLFKEGIKLPGGDCDDEGKTALHLAAMCEDDNKAMEMVIMILENIEEKEKVVVKCDKRFRTALHEAALNGNKELCSYLLDTEPKIINLKDRDGRHPIYDAVNGRKKEEGIIKMLLDVCSKKDISLYDLIDRNGLTPLHIAASLGKTDLVKLFISNAKNGKQYLKRSDLIEEKASEYLMRSDFHGQTALHKAANYGESDTVKILLNEGAHPLKERDCDGRTALHYAVQAKTGGDKIKLVNSILEGCKTNEEKWLLLWASAAGLGTADNSLSRDDELHKFFVDKKNEINAQLPTGNLLKTAASMGNIEMTKELITRGYQIGDINDIEWTKELKQERYENVQRVSRQLERIAEQGNDQPTVLDNLGRIDYAYGLAALFLNPYIKPPIVVGISGSWGMGKSSLMVQTESILLKTAAQMALLQSPKLPSSASDLPEITVSALSKKGRKKYVEIKRYIDFDQTGIRTTLFYIMKDKIWSWAKKIAHKEFREEIGRTEQDSLVKFLYNYQPKYRKIFKSLAAMDSNGTFTTRMRENQAHKNQHSMFKWLMVRDVITANYRRSKSSSQKSTTNSPLEESIPAVLTVQYNAWKYRNETEALAGMAVEITKELEGIMTEAQWLSTCWRNTWKKAKYNIWIEIIYPCLLAVILTCTITSILWIILNKSEKFKDWIIAKYACLPTTIVIVGWTVTKSIMSILKPVSTELMSYISFPDHTDKLGYQERVISDINFLKDEIGRKPCMVFKAYSWVSTIISTIWFLFFEWWFTPLFFHHKISGNTMPIPKISPAFGTNLRIIVFIDDLDRCQESVILQVLSAINLVLAVCEINVVLGIDKGLIERAIIKKYGDLKSNRPFKDNQELVDKYLQKIIQLPLDLPDPSAKQSRKFLEGQLGVFREPSEDPDSELKPKAGMTKILRQKTFMQEGGRSRESTLWDIAERETGSEITIDVPATTVTCYGSARLLLQFLERQLYKLFMSCPSNFHGRKDEVEATASNATSAQADNKNYWSQIPLRELLFVRYSKGEQDAFCYFQQFATDSRKLPREWKRHLTYHRLVWNIFYLTGEAKDLAGWQVQLITWIFVCWEWRENMDFVIQNWNKIEAMKTSSSDGPSLQRIVDHFIELEIGAASHQEETKETILKVGVSKDINNETESSKREQKKLDEAVKDNIVMEDGGRPLFQEKSQKKNKRKKKKKTEEMREKSLIDIDDQQRSKRTGEEKLGIAVVKQIGKLEKMLDELKQEINDLKDEAMKKRSRKNEKRDEEKRMKLKRWETLRLALDKYDVPMNAIQAFQRFRFYCIAGHLSWPLSEQVQRKKKSGSYED